MSVLEGKKILLGVTGSIAAYKSIILLRLLKREGADVQVIFSDSANNFVTQLTFSTLSDDLKRSFSFVPSFKFLSSI